MKDLTRRVAAWLSTELGGHSVDPAAASPVADDAPTDRPILALVEQVAIALQTAAGDRFTPAEFAWSRREERETATYPYLHEEVGLAAGRLAVEVVRAAMTDRASLDNVDMRFRTDVLAVAEKVGYGPSTREVVAAARRRGIPVTRPEPGRLLVALGQAANQRRIWATATERTSLVGAYVAGDKALTSRMLREALLPVPAEAVAESVAEAIAAADRIGYPVVVKPLDGNHGRGITLDIADPANIAAAVDAALAFGKSRCVLVQRQIVGRDYRVLVVGGRHVAVAERVPAGVDGDGGSTVQELVDLANADPRRGDGHARPLTRLRLDAAAIAVLTQQGLTPTSVAAVGQRVTLARTANLSTGGTAIDRTDDIHPDTARLVEEAVAIVGLDVAGVDLITEDIGAPLFETGGAIVEINAAPGLRMHTSPSEGRPRPVGDAIVEMLFPAGAPTRIPTVAVTGTNGKTTTTRMVAHLLRATGLVVGLTCTDGIYLGDRMLAAGDMAGPASARMVLRHPLVEAAALECARGGIVREGLGFDQCDVAIVTNVSADHLGLGGVETLEDLAEVKGVVPSAVRPGGASILNAEDPLVLAMAKSAGGEIILFAGDESNAAVRSHVGARGRAAVIASVDGAEMIRLLAADSVLDVIDVRDIPATLGGRLRVNALNALAAAAAVWSLGVPVSTIGEALATFEAGAETTPGRFNLIEVEGRQVIIDYAHNVAALEAIGDVVRRFDAPRSVAMLAIPGDRSDADARALATVAAGIFDAVVIREGNTRGRSPGETARILRQAIVDAGMPEHEVRVVLDEVEAAHATVDHAHPGDLAVIFVTRPKLIWDEMTARVATGAQMAVPTR